MTKIEFMSDLRPGDLMFGPIKGAAGLLVNTGQLLLGEGFHVGELDVRHVGVVVGTDRTHVPGSGMVPSIELVEAVSSGARLVTRTLFTHWTPEYAYARLAEDYPGQAGDAAAVARLMMGTPYSFASYLALAAWRLGISTPRLEGWISRRQPAARPVPWRGSIADPNWGLPEEAICSVLADQAWTLTGKKIMVGVPHQCVTPGALARRLLTDPAVSWGGGPWLP